MSLIETDAPYLTPTPFRGTRNEPKYIEYVAKEIVKLDYKPIVKKEVVPIVQPTVKEEENNVQEFKINILKINDNKNSNK